MEEQSSHSTRVISDPNLTSNGFDLRCRKDSSGTISVLEITGITRLIPGYGLQDLKEILQMVMNNPDPLLLHRPKKALDWFSNEAKRLSSKTSPSVVRCYFFSLPSFFPSLLPSSREQELTRKKP